MKLSKSLVVTVMVLIAFNVMVLPAAMAGSVFMDATANINASFTETVTTDLDFGTIDLNPGGDTITLDASTGSTTTATTANGSVVSSPTSGLITIEHSMIVNLWVEYPAGAVTLTGAVSGDTIDIIAGSIASNSEYPNLASSFTSDTNTDIEIDVGGALDLDTSGGPITDDLYSGQFEIIIHYQ